MIFKVCSFKADEPTANGRIYPKALMEKAIKEAQGKVKDGTMLVSLYDKNTDSFESLTHTIGVVRSLKLEHNETMVEFDLLDTPAAKIVADIINDVKIMPMGVGEVEDGIKHGKVTHYDIERFIIDK